LKEILIKMEAIGDIFEAEGKIESKNISNVVNRKFWLIPNDESPSCENVEMDQISMLAAIKINL
jgi:hypothetical protein